MITAFLWSDDRVMSLDALDARLLLLLDDDPETTVLALAHRLGVARNTVHARLKRLQSGGALGAVTRRLDPAALGYGLTAFVWISVSQEDGERTSDALARLPEVIEIHATTGEADFLAKVVARDTADLHRLTTRMLLIEGVLRTNTTVSLHEVLAPRLRALLEELASG